MASAPLNGHVLENRDGLLTRQSGCALDSERECPRRKSSKPTWFACHKADLREFAMVVWLPPEVGVRRVMGAWTGEGLEAAAWALVDYLITYSSHHPETIQRGCHGPGASPLVAGVGGFRAVSRRS